MAPAQGGDDAIPDNLDEWTLVTGRRGRKGVPFRRYAGELPAGGEPRPVEEIRDMHDRLAGPFRSSSCGESIRSLLSGARESHPPITRAICLGIGSFGTKDGCQSVRTPHVQMEAFLLIVEILSEQSGRAIPCVFQEPCFTSSDRSFVESLGHKVVDSPAAFALVDPTTFVFGVHMYWSLWQEALRRSLPAMLVGTNMELYGMYPRSGGDCLLADHDRIAEVERKFMRLPFPQDGTFFTFSDTSLHLLRDTVETSRGYNAHSSMIGDLKNAELASPDLVEKPTAGTSPNTALRLPAAAIDE